MNAEIKQRWIAALRSGKYQQGKGVLRNAGNEYCCLGVLCEVYAEDKKVSLWRDFNGMSYGFLDSRTSLSVPIMEWAELVQNNPDLVHEGNERSCIALNDDYNCSFNQISDAIEKSL